jgi:hypothetical protein
MQAFTGKYAPEYQIVHLELPIMHKPLVVASEHLAVPCILESCFPSFFVEKVDIIMPKLVLRSFVICLQMGGDHGDFWGDNNFGPIHQEERHLRRGPASRCLVGPQCAQKLIN